MKWLKQLQEERRRQEEKKEAEHKQNEERKRSFMEREAAKRAKGNATNNNDRVPEKCAPSTPSTLEDTDDSTVASSIASTVSKRKVPAWCQSEAAHEAAEDTAVIDDENNLLDFVNGLDYEKYNEDLELQTLMGQVKKRIKLLEREHKKDETKLQTCLDVSSSVAISLCIFI